ncbi:hypothetical protein FQN49_007301 [Arthroderma sp. PD_2]|nr:hypothetical protein FQN49_007301 [Arthroderma sp. PD_2]
MLIKIALLALLAQGSFAQGVSGNGNLTVSFFADDQEECPANDTSQGITLTTSTVPYGYTCFNVTDIFSQPNKTGFQNATQEVHNINQPNGIYWLLQNQENFDPQSNYSSVWYEQVNKTGEAVAGREGSWVLFFYPFPNCEQVGGDGLNEDEYPWFETSCQTMPGGQCRTVPHPIKSFAILSAAGYNQVHKPCETWAFKGAATSLKQPSLQLIAVLASLLVIFLVP